MSHSLNSLKYIGDYIGEYYRVIKGDSRSLDYSSHDFACKVETYIIPVSMSLSIFFSFDSP